MIYVITRTNNRPNKFRLCAETVQEQTVDCTHVMLCENEIAGYVHPYHFVPMEKTTQAHVMVKGDFKHYNQYLDWALQNIGSDGDYFAFLDDDNFYLRPDALELAIKEGANSDLIMWRVNVSNNIVVPRDMASGKVAFGDIDMNGFLVRKGSFKNATFGDKLGGDYNFLKDAVTECKSVAWVDRVLSSTTPLDSFGGGNEQDLDYKRVLTGYELAKKQFNNGKFTNSQ